MQVPPFECFANPEAYYATLAHDCTHWTRHPTRRDHDFGRKRWGDLSGDRRFIFSAAAAHAQKAVEFMRIAEGAGR